MGIQRVHPGWPHRPSQHFPSPATSSPMLNWKCVALSEAQKGSGLMLSLTWVSETLTTSMLPLRRGQGVSQNLPMHARKTCPAWTSFPPRKHTACTRKMTHNAIPCSRITRQTWTRQKRSPGRGVRICASWSCIETNTSIILRVLEKLVVLQQRKVMSKYLDGRISIGARVL